MDHLSFKVDRHTLEFYTKEISHLPTKTISIIMIFLVPHYEKKEEIWHSPITKAPTPQKIQKATWQHKNGTKILDYTMNADRLRTVGLGNDSHPTGVVKQVYGIQTFPLTAKYV